MKRALQLAARHWLRLAALALGTLGGCLNPLPDDLPSATVSPPRAAGSGTDGRSPGQAAPAAGDGFGAPSAPVVQTPATEPATVTDAEPAADAGSAHRADAGACADAGPTEADLGVQ